MRAIIIGAGPAGLASAATLKQRGVDVTILEKAANVGSSWRNHYDRLKLHTSRGRSNLPGLALPDSSGRYPSRDEFVHYLETYCRNFDLALRFDTEVQGVTTNPGGGWNVRHAGGVDQSDVVVFATGLNERPYLPDWPGLASFPGKVLHASSYHRADPFQGQRVLVVGFGNSGGDIALDLAEQGSTVDMAVRGPVNLLPKELFGIPITSFGLLRKILPYKAADAITQPIVRLKLGRTEDYGLVPAGKGPISQIIEDGRIPLIDVGTLGAIKAGKIAIRPAPAEFEGAACTFVDGSMAVYDTIILATGYRVDLRSLLPDADGVLDTQGRPIVSGGPTAQKGLYFCSYVTSANGQIFQMSREAEAIARHVAQSRT